MPIFKTVPTELTLSIYQATKDWFKLKEQVFYTDAETDDL